MSSCLIQPPNDTDNEEHESPNAPETANKTDEEDSWVPYPSGQLFILGCCRISEPITMMSISPYLYFMIRDMHITDDKNIGRYAGVLSSCYNLSQFLSGTIVSLPSNVKAWHGDVYPIPPAANPLLSPAFWELSQRLWSLDSPSRTHRQLSHGRWLDYSMAMSV